MPDFPIQYRRVAPPEPGGVRANVDTDVGEAASYSGLAAVGQTLSAVGRDVLSQIRRAEQMTGDSKAQLEISTLTSAFESSLPTTGDETARQKLLEKYESDVSAFGNSPERKVMANRAIASARQTAMKVGMEMKIRNLRDETVHLLDRHIETGNAEAYRDTVVRAVDSNLITQAEADHRLGTYEKSSALARLKVAVEKLNLGDVKALDEQLIQMDLTGEELEYKNRLMDTVGRQTRFNADGELREVLAGAEKIRALPPVERLAQGEQLISRLMESGATPAEIRVNTDRIRQIIEGRAEGAVKSNALVRGGLIERVSRVNVTSGAEEVDELSRDIDRQWYEGNLSTTHHGELKKAMEGELQQSQAKAIDALVAVALRKKKLPAVIGPMGDLKADDSEFRLEMLRMAKAHPEWGPAELYARGMALLPVWDKNANRFNVLDKDTATAAVKAAAGSSVLQRWFLGGGGTPKIENDADFEALPAGAVFIAPDGKKRIKK